MTAYSASYEIDVGRDEARRAAEDELRKGVYHHDDPSLLERLYDDVARWLDNALEGAGNASPGGTVGLVLVLVMLAVLALVVAYRVSALSRAATVSAALFDDEVLDADAHRRAADRHAAAGDYADAVRERLRAIVRELEQRGVLEPRAGRTADEAATEAGAALPDVAVHLRAAARIFDDIWYGGRPADAGADARLREVDQRVRSQRVSSR